MKKYIFGNELIMMMMMMSTYSYAQTYNCFEGRIYQINCYSVNMALFQKKTDVFIKCLSKLINPYQCNDLKKS